MNLHSRFLPGLFALMSVSGCVCVTGPGASRGDISFSWTFAGRQCFEVPDVTQVTVQIPGQTLQNNGVYNCLNAGSAGIKLLKFAPGTYQYTVLGQNSQGTVLYQASGQVSVDGDEVVSVDLQPTANATGAMYVSWDFPAGTTVTCGQYLPWVDIVVDNGTPVTVNCADGATSPGVLIQNLTPGTHTLDVMARNADNFYYYRTVTQVGIYAGGASAQQISLQWIVGSATLKWSFSNGVTQLNCAQAGVVGDIAITLRDRSDNTDTPLSVPCLNNGVQGVQIPFVYYGEYEVFLAAVGTGGVEYRSDWNNPPTVTVEAGEFPQVDNPTPTPVILMTP